MSATFRYYKVHYFAYLSQTVAGAGGGGERPNTEKNQNLFIKILVLLKFMKCGNSHGASCEVKDKSLY